MTRFYDALEKARRDRGLSPIPMSGAEIYTPSAEDGAPTTRRSRRRRSERKPPAPALDISHEMNQLFATLHPLINERGSLVVHVAASVHREGASTIARELAATAARTEWCRVILIDGAGFDPAAPRLPSRKALLHQFGERGALEPSTTQVPAGQVMTGTLLASAKGLPSQQTLRDFYAAAREHFSLVIVDCPPVMDVAASAAMAQAADGVILVVRAEHTRIPVVQRACTTLEMAGAHILGVVLNRRRMLIPNFLYRYL